MNIFKENESPEELGEFGLIDRIMGMFEPKNDHDFTGLGDDCAVIRNASGRSLLITTDIMLEEGHFRREWISAEDLGYKSLAANLSDISAMGGSPHYALLSIGLPPDTSPDWLNDFFSGANQLCESHGVNLIGGNTTKSGSIIINYTALGFINDENILWRSAAKLGDKIGLIGKVGESGAGLRLLQEAYDKEKPNHKHLIKAHNRPTLLINEAKFLADTGSVHAMIDLSDGIQSDAGHITKQSGVTFSINADRLPLSKQLFEVCDKYSWSAEEIALTAGEDYSLLFTFDSKKEDFLKRRFRELFPETVFSVIGDVKEGDAEVLFFKGNEKLELHKQGFDQFKSK
ncbi:thiamine-phosphate kinase [Gracilimonas sp. Q87]|uniref:thiamine-phosphate kinase n=1 Tax=Gracilimonas sp. Q87 TaxID=3384766 RepID=UPI00398429D9